MIDSLTKVKDLEREATTQLDLTAREQAMLEALRYMLDRFTSGWSRDNG